MFSVGRTRRDVSLEQHEPALSTYQNEFWDEDEFANVETRPVDEMDQPGRTKSFWLGLGLVVVVGLIGGVLMSRRSSVQAFNKKNAVVGMKQMISSEKQETKVIGDVLCPAGKYFASSSCHTCPAGYYCNSNKKIICPTGTYQPAAGKSTCTPTDCGKFAPAPGSTTQETCRAGTYSPKRATRCTPTPVGYYSGAGACVAKKCPPGQFQDCKGQSNCHPSPCGHYISGFGNTGYSPCGVGTYQPMNSKETCINTKPGEYAGKGQCKPSLCTPGSYQNSPKMGSCNPASCGHYVPGAGATAQLKCGTGKYQPQAGEPGCLAIPAGYISTNNGCKIQCCPAGQYRDAAFKCVPAPCGHFVSQACSSSPTKCPPGHYTTGTGATGCMRASPGSVPNANQCGSKKCPPGSYQNLFAQTSCKPAPCGTKAPAPGTANPMQCAAGSYQDKTGQTGCLPCPVGTANNALGKCACPRCSAGTFQPSTGQKTCKDSPCGHHVPGSGATKASPCPPGRYQPQTKQAGCIAAPPGKYAVGGTCTPGTCPPGTFTPSAGMVKCTEAPCGTIVNKAGQSGTSVCPAGQYQPLPGQTSCLPAPTGSFTDGSGKCAETLCKPGKFQNQAGQTGCKPADCGHYVATTGSASQSPCGAGRYQPATGKTSCLKADLGHFVSGNTACKQERCPSGSYTDCKGQSGCVKATCGHFVAGTGKSTMTPCPAGMYQDTAGQPTCKTNPRGTFSKSGYCKAQLCDPGTFQNAQGKSTCISASCGNFVAGEGQTTESKCNPASYQPKMGQVGCLPTTHGNAPNPGTCEKGTVVGSMYYKGPGRSTWTAAKAWCKNNGDRLAIAKNAKENAEIVRICGGVGKACWIGATDAVKEGVWKWVDGTPFAGGYTNWHNGEPNNANNEDCGMTWANGQWNDGHCHVAEFFVCERRRTLTIKDSNYEAALQTATGCSKSSFRVGGAPGSVAKPTNSQMWVPSAVSSCVKALDKVMLWNSATGEYQLNSVSAMTTSGAHTLLTFTNPLTRPQTGSGRFNFVVRPIYSKGNIIVSPTTTFAGKAWDGSSGGVMVLWSDSDIIVKRNIDVSGRGFRGGVVGLGPEGPTGRLSLNGGGGGGGAPGHGCAGSAGWKAHLIGHGVDGGGNPVQQHGIGGHGGAGSPNGGGGGGAGYGYHAGNGGAAKSPGGSGGNKVGNVGHNGKHATGARGGGGGGGGDRDNGGGGGGGTPVSSLDNKSTATRLFLGGGAAAGAGGGGGGGQGDYQCAAGGWGGYKLGKGGKVGGDSCSKAPKHTSTAGSNGGSGGSGGGLVVLLSKKLTIEPGVTILAKGAAGGNGGSGGRGKYGTCGTHPFGGAGGGGGGANGAAGGTVAYAGTLQKSGGIAINGGRGGAGGPGGMNSRGKGGQGGNGGAGAAGRLVKIAAPPVV